MEPGQIPPKADGLSRLVKAFFYSLAGVRSVFKTEAAFRQEVFVLPATTFLAWWLPLDMFWSLWLTFGAVFFLLLELINTALERLVDLASPGYHLLAKEAKDIGSALVLIGMGFYGLLWVLAAYSLWQH